MPSCTPSPFTPPPTLCSMPSIHSLRDRSRQFTRIWRQGRKECRCISTVATQLVYRARTLIHCSMLTARHALMPRLRLDSCPDFCHLLARVEMRWRSRPCTPIYLPFTLHITHVSSLQLARNTDIISFLFRRSSAKLSEALSSDLPSWAASQGSPKQSSHQSPFPT